jgi:hypothetical protein
LCCFVWVSYLLRLDLILPHRCQTYSSSLSSMISAEHPCPTKQWSLHHQSNFLTCTKWTFLTLQYPHRPLFQHYPRTVLRVYVHVLTVACVSNHELDITDWSNATVLALASFAMVDVQVLWLNARHVKLSLVLFACHGGSVRLRQNIEACWKSLGCEDQDLTKMAVGH